MGLVVGSEAWIASMTSQGQDTDRACDEANALEDAGRLQEALNKWREVVAQKPTAVSLCRLGSVAAELKERREAEHALEASIAAAGNWSLPLEVLALVHRDQGDPGEAESNFRRRPHIKATAAWRRSRWPRNRLDLLRSAAPPSGSRAGSAACRTSRCPRGRCGPRPR